MKSVVICGSAKFSDEIYHFAARLKKIGVPVIFTPNFKNASKSFLTLEEKERLASKSYRRRVPGMVLQHFDRIRKADVCFVYNKNGYIGVNTTLEVGFAHGRDMIIYSLEPEKTHHEGGEPCRHILFTEVVPTPEELYEKLIIITSFSQQKDGNEKYK